MGSLVVLGDGEHHAAMAPTCDFCFGYDRARSLRLHLHAETVKKITHERPEGSRRNHSFRTSAGSLAIFAAILRASSRVSKRSQRRPSFFNVRYSTACPMIALFFFESETAGLMFV